MSLSEELKRERAIIERAEAEEAEDAARKAAERWEELKITLDTSTIPRVYKETVEKIRVENAEGRKEFRYSWSTHRSSQEREAYIADGVMAKLKADGLMVERELIHVSTVGMDAEGYGGTTNVYGAFKVIWE